MESISDWFDAHPELLDTITADPNVQTEGSCCGLRCDSVLRCGVLKHLRDETKCGLAVAFRDSLFACRFARVCTLDLPKKSALQAEVGTVFDMSHAPMACWLH